MTPTQTPLTEEVIKKALDGTYQKYNSSVGDFIEIIVPLEFIPNYRATDPVAGNKKGATKCPPSNK